MFLTFYVLATAFPLYVRDVLHGNSQQMGLAITIYVIGSVLIRPFSGFWVDRFGKKRVAVIGMILFLLACIAYFGASGIMLFLVIRLIHGMTYAVASTATSTMASAMIPEKSRGEGMGYFSMFMSIAMVVGPSLGLTLWSGKNEHVLLFSICGITALSLIFLLAVKDQQSSEPEPVTETVIQQSPVASAAKGFQWNNIIEPKAFPISLVGFALAFAYSPISAFMALFTNEIHETRVTSLFFVVFAVMIVVFRPVVGKIFDRLNEHVLYYPGIILFGLGLIVLSQSSSAFMVLASAVLMGTGYGALFPCFQALAIRMAPSHRSGAANSTFFLMFDLGYGVGSYVMGAVAAATNYRFMFGLAGVVALITMLIYYMLHHRRTDPKQAVQVNSTN